MDRKDEKLRLLVAVVSIAGLMAVFLFQKVNVGMMLGVARPVHQFLINRTIRFLLNDAFALLLIYAIFRERKYVVFAIWAQLAGVILFLIPYYVLKLYFPSYNGPLISFLHRLILNPTLLMLLIPAFYLQRLKAIKPKTDHQRLE